MKLVNIGYGNLLNADRMIAAVAPDSAPVKRMIAEAKDQGSLIDATCGKKTRAVIMTDSGHVILTALQTETLAHRLSGAGQAQGGDTDE